MEKATPHGIRVMQKATARDMENRRARTKAMARALVNHALVFGCGGLDHIHKNCPMNKHVNEVNMEEPEILFIGATENTMLQEQCCGHEDEKITVKPSPTPKKHVGITSWQTTTPIATRNGYEPLQEQDEVEGQEGEEEEAFEATECEICALSDMKWDEDGVRCVLQTERATIEPGGKAQWVSMGQG